MSKSKSESSASKQPGILDVVKHRWQYMIVSFVFLIPGIFYLVTNFTNPDIKAPVKLGIDFVGGTMLEYGVEKPLSQADVNAVRTVFEDKGYTGTVVQIQEPRVGINKEAIQLGAAPAEEEPAQTAVETSEKGDVASIVSIRSKQLAEEDLAQIKTDLESKFGTLTLLQKNSIGPSLASELLGNGFLALILAYVLIVGYLTFRFEFDYAVCAIIALVHDALFVFGCFAMLSAMYNTEVDSMFVTAILTVVGFSVHDTIVVFDRVRENYRVYYTKKVPFNDIVNLSVNQTLARSINTSLSALLPLIALYFFGGETTKDFVLACILGITVGTYSSIFIASSLLALWREKKQGKPIAAKA